MGITIHYSGSINSLSRIDNFCDELADIADSMQWPFHRINTIADFADSDEPGPSTDLNGIILELHPDCESLSFLFDSSGQLRSPTLLMSEPFDTDNYIWIKTQFARPKIHIAVVKLLKYLQKVYMHNLSVNDEGCYWETNDKAILEQKLSFISGKLDSLENTLEHSVLTPMELNNTDVFLDNLESIISRAMEKSSASDISDSKINRNDDDSFFKFLDNFENGAQTTHKAELEKRGVMLPNPVSLSDEEVTCKLWEVIYALADLSAFLTSTDHLNDRELYTVLVTDILLEDTVPIPPGCGTRCHIDILGSCSVEDIRTNLKFYASEKERQYWIKDFPDYDIPEHVDPPYDRDQHLPHGGI